MDRVKTDMRLPKELIEHVEEVAELVGLPKNAFFTVAAAQLAASLSGRYVEGVKRRTMLRRLEKLVQKTFADAKNNL